MGALIGWAVAWGCRDLPAQDRWLARFAKGDVVTSPELSDWSEPAARPRIQDRELIDTQNPAVLLLDLQSSMQLPQPTMFVEFFGGDRLAGEVLEQRTASPNPYEQLPAHVILRTTGNLQRPDDPVSETVRLTARWLKRVVWEPVTRDQYTPGSVWLRGGGQIEYRSLRWGEGSLILLTSTGLRNLSFAEVAEIHFPNQDEWQTYQAQLAVLSPTLSSRLMQLDLQDGSRLTTSLERFVARHWGDRKRTDAWLQLVQPAWSLDPLWIRFPQVTSWTWFDATQPPLSWSSPSNIQRDSVFGASWQWQRDRNTLGERLHIGTSPFARGLGVHATTDLTFPLPPMARQVRVAGGLDRRAESGGSVRLSVLDPSANTKFQSDPLVGSRQIVDSGWIDIGATPPEATAIVLRADMLRGDRPSGSDPFDIRDIVNWVDPQVRFDRQLLQQAVDSERVKCLPGWSGWQFPSAAAAPLLTRNHLDESEGRDPHYRLLAAVAEPYLLLSRTMPVTAADRWFSLVVSRFEALSKPTLVQIKIDGRSAGEYEIPIRYGPIDPDPLTVPLPTGPDRTVQVDVVIYSSGADSWLDWRGFAVTAERPGLRFLYDDDASAFRNAAIGPALTTSSEQPMHGRESLEIAAGAVDMPQIEGLQAALVDLPKLGQYRYLTFAWKGSETPGLVFRLAHEGRLGAEIAGGLGLGARTRWRRMEDRGLRYGFSYDMGSAKQAEGAPLRLDKKLHSEWKLETRDVVGDFGPLLLTGFGLECVDSGRGWFDAIALARTPQDLDWLRKHWSEPPAGAIDLTKERYAGRREDWNQAIAEFAPMFATAEARHGMVFKPEHQGQSGSWQTHPHDRDQPFVLRTVTTLPEDRPQELDLLVSHQVQHDWLLQVRGNGSLLHEQVINDALTIPQRGYASLQVDLSQFQGQTVLLEVLNASNDWSQEHAYWKRVHLRNRE